MVCEAAEACIKEHTAAVTALTELVHSSTMAVGANTSDGIRANGHKHQHHQHYASSPAWWKPPVKFRPPGAPAGAWPHLPWHASVLHDPYERINFWSHFVPGLVFLMLG